jgi:hypothetical protein
MVKSGIMARSDNIALLPMGESAAPLTMTKESESLRQFASRSPSLLSFKNADEFFHGMLSYRVRTEGPVDKGGNNLARLIYNACCKSCDVSIEKTAMHTSESLHHFYKSLESFGRWPKAFSEQSKGFRLFLDQVNLRMGVPWKGTGDADNGGFLGAVSQALLIVPLLSATPTPLKVSRVVGTSEFYTLECPINMKIVNGTEIVSILLDQGSGEQTIRGHYCEDVQPDGSFQLSAVPKDDASDFPSKYQFYSATNFLPSDGSGPRGSLAELLTLQQESEDLTFSVESVSGGIVILQADQLSDHIFFSTEMISLNAPPAKASFKILQVVCQGSKVGMVFSKIKVDIGEHAVCFTSGTSKIPGTTQKIDRCDNVLMELMLCRALRTLAASGNLHPCKLIMPVFVDDMDLLYPLSDRLSESNSHKTSLAVKSALEAIMKRNLTRSEEQEWILCSVKSVVKFFFDFQGLQLSDKTNRYKTMKEKACLVQRHIVITCGIEANNNALFRYVSNNPLALELLNFLDDAGLMHLHPVLVKHDITCVKEFSLISHSAIEKIAFDGHELSTRPLIKETVEICRAISAAQSSKLILPVSKRLKLFEDKEASFLTVIYSSYAIYLALQKPFFSFGIQFIFGSIALGIGVYQIFTDPVRNLPFILPNFARCLWMLFAMCSVFIFKSLKAAFRSWVFWSFMTGLGCLLGFILDKIVDGNFAWDYSKDCAASKSPKLFPAMYASCVQFNYAYFAFNTAFYWVMTYCILLRQNVVWRCLVIGITLQIMLAAYIDSTSGEMTTMLTLEILGCFFVPSCLAITEILRFYGTLQALQITKQDSINNTRRWKQVLDESGTDVEQMAQMINQSFDHAILDRSPELGTYLFSTRALKKCAPIRQPIKDFDELYDIASVINNTFQAWVESFFGSDSPSALFLYLDDQESTDHLHEHLRFRCFHGTVSRGPVKLPERAIAKVPIAFILFFFAMPSSI